MFKMKAILYMLLLYKVTKGFSSLSLPLSPLFYSEVPDLRLESVVMRIFLHCDKRNLVVVRRIPATST